MKERRHMTKVEAGGDVSNNALAVRSTVEETDHVRGFMVRRRSLLWLPVLTASALMLNLRGTLFAQQAAREESTGAFAVETKAGQSQPVTTDIAWGDFIKQGVPELQELYKFSSPGGQDAYLYSLAHWAARLRLETIPRARLFRFEALNPPVHFGVGYRGVPFMVVEWWLEPDAFLPPHNHPNYSVCTLGIEGEARIRNFQIAGDAPDFTSKDIFHVRETHSQLMSAGRINSLSPARDNIHTFKAGKSGARGVDFGTLYGKDIGFSFLNIEEKPRDAEGRIYEASWRKTP
jgi:hypothetical protein